MTRRLHAKGILTAPTTSGLQVGRDLTRALVERVVRLDKARQLLKVHRGKILWIRTQS